uniref:Uncharacterized protein n=1 Tax=Callorhinchus milii TaxID=7868 RepID=A0A4W3HR99_CALMI
MAVRGVGRCPMVFLLALALDVVGLTVLFIGVFADVRMAGRALGDCLIYSGAIGIFLSLVAWLFWFTGNIQVSLEQLEKDALATRQTRHCHGPQTLTHIHYLHVFFAG